MAIAAAFGVQFTYERETVAYLHPGMTAAVYCNGRRLGVFGKLANEITAELKIAKDEKSNQNIYLGELDYGAMAEVFPAELRYRPLSPFAAAARAVP